MSSKVVISHEVWTGIKTFYFNSCNFLGGFVLHFFWNVSRFCLDSFFLNSYCYFLSICYECAEITERFESAPLNHRKVMLEILLPWLYNVELVGEPNKDISSISRHERDIDPEDQDHGSPLKTCGWGSKQASDIVLNNLFFITSEVRKALIKCILNVLQLLKRLYFIILLPIYLQMWRIRTPLFCVHS